MKVCNAQTGQLGISFLSPQYPGSRSPSYSRTVSLLGVGAGWGWLEFFNSAKGRGTEMGVKLIKKKRMTEKYYSEYILYLYNWLEASVFFFFLHL